MSKTLVRRLSMVALAFALCILSAMVALAAGAHSPIEALTALAGLLFGYLIFRLSRAVFATNPPRRAWARRGLIASAAIPVVILTPLVVGALPREYTPALLLASAVWLALSVASMAFIVAKAAPPAPRPVTRRRRLPGQRLALHGARLHHR